MEMEDYQDPSAAGTPTLVETPTSEEQFKQNAQTQASAAQQLSKYAQLLSVLEEMGKDIRPTYAGSKSSSERLKRSIVHARILVRECLMETERSGRQ